MNRTCQRCGGGRLICGICYREPIDCRHLRYDDEADLLGVCTDLTPCVFCARPPSPVRIAEAERVLAADLERMRRVLAGEREDGP